MEANEWYNTDEWCSTAALKNGATVLMNGATVKNGAAVLMNGASLCSYCWNIVVLELTQRELEKQLR